MECQLCIQECRATIDILKTGPRVRSLQLDVSSAAGLCIRDMCDCSGRRDEDSVHILSHRPSHPRNELSLMSEQPETCDCLRDRSTRVWAKKLYARDVTLDLCSFLLCNMPCHVRSRPITRRQTLTNGTCKRQG